MVLSVIGFILLTFLPADFNYAAFFIILFILGCGMGMFSAPNTTAIMNSVPANQRGASSGMRSTLQNTGMAVSMTLYFTILIVGMLQNLPSILYSGLVNAGVSASVAQQAASLPPTTALFSAFLGYNPISSMLGADVIAKLPSATKTIVLGNQFFPTTIAPAVMSSLKIAFYISAFLSLVAAVASFLRGKRYVHGEESTED